MSTVTVDKWDFHDKNIQGSVAQNNFTRADRVVIYTAPSPIGNQTSSTFNAIGLIQGMSHSEQKQLQTIFELGSDAPMIIPGLTQGQIQLQRVLLNGLNFLNTIYHGATTKNLSSDQILRSIRDINRPFDMLLAKYPVIMNADTQTSADAPVSAVETTLFRGCQIQSRSESITAGGTVVLEQLNVMYATIPKVTFKLN